MNKQFDDFEVWARQCVRIADKLTGRTVPFILNRPQKRVLGELEAMRRAGKPIRLIMLKSRQWGGSTLIEAYIAWMQLVRRKGWNAVICAHVKDASTAIRGMYARLLANYPEELREGGKKEWELQPYQKSASTSWIPARDCLVAVASSQSPNSLRGYNFHLAHLSEVAFWADDSDASAEEIVRTVCGTVPMEPDSLVVMESTANGTDNYFYDEWRRAVEGRSDKQPVFVPWYEIDIYRKPELPEAAKRRLLRSLDDYERGLMEQHGVELDRIAWYHEKRREYPCHEAMMAEFPSTPEEAFRSGKGSFFDPGELPELSGKSADAVACRTEMLVLVPGHKSAPHLLSRFERRGRRLVAAEDRELKTTLEGALSVAAESASAAGCPLRIAAYPEREGAARWLGARAVKRGVAVEYDDEQSPYILLEPRMLEAAAEELREGYAARTMGETQQQALDELRTFRLTTAPGQRTITRLVAAQSGAMRDSDPAGMRRLVAATDSLRRVLHPREYGSRSGCR